MTLFLPFVDYSCNEDLIWTKTFRNCWNGSQKLDFSLHMMQDARSRFSHAAWWLLALSIFVICLPVIGYLSCFHSPDTVNRAAMNTVFLVWYRVLWVAAQERHSWDPVEDLFMVFQGTAALSTPNKGKEALSFPTSVSASVLKFSKYSLVVPEERWNLKVILVHISPIAKNVEIFWKIFISDLYFIFWELSV